ncbi:hypothetical protein H0R92_03770 [Treponema sp. OMZ 840]|uniref:hypothetical protein n=1 Tax=Treponema sp. OMZ 840 TaxID=244313 RepID=UPI003D92E9F7
MKAKKTGFILLCLIFTASLFFTGCLSLIDSIFKQSAREDLAKDIKGSPEEMLVIYGEPGFTGGLWFQANTKKAPSHAYFYTENEGAVSLPLVPGGRYHQYFDWTVVHMGNNVTTTYYLHGLNGNTDSEFIVPEKTGIYYFGDSIETLKPGFAKNQKDTKTAKERKEAELRAVKSAYKVYADTAWGPLFKARMEELKNEK